MFAEMQKLNLEIIPEGTLNHISIEPTLYDRVIMAQVHDKGVGIIKQKVLEGEQKYKCFHLDHKGILWFESCLVVPKNQELRKQILDEAHLSKFSIHHGSTKMHQDLRQNFWWIRIKREIAKYVVECDTRQRVKVLDCLSGKSTRSMPGGRFVGEEGIPEPRVRWLRDDARV